MTRPWVLVAFHLSSPMSRLASEKAAMAGEEKRGINGIMIKSPHALSTFKGTVRTYIQCTFKRHYGQIAPHFILLRIAMLFLF